MKNRFYLYALSLLLLTAVFFSGPVAAGSGKSGHIAYYLFDSPDTNNNTSYGVEAANDFLYYYGNLEAWLEKNNLSKSFHEDKEFDITAPLGKKLSFTAENFLGGNDIGVIIIRPGGSFKMIEGVLTDVDLMFEIEGYLNQDIKK